MRLAMAGTTVALLLAISGCTGSATTPRAVSTTSPASVPPTTSPRPVVAVVAGATVAADCAGSTASVRSTHFFLACGDGAVYLAVSSWSQWSAASAAGLGAVYVDNCQPDCATGHFARYPARVSLRTPVIHGLRRYFATLVITFGQNRPGHQRVVYCPLHTPAHPDSGGCMDNSRAWS